MTSVFAASRERTRGRTRLTMGLPQDADVRATDVELTRRRRAIPSRRNVVRESACRTPRHPEYSCGLAVAKLFDIDFAALREAVHSLVPGKMRGERIERGGIDR